MNKIGAIWTGKTKDGEPYLSGVIEYPGMKYRIVAFKNKNREKETQPAFFLYYSPEDNNGNGNGSSGKKFDDDIPFD